MLVDSLSATHPRRPPVLRAFAPEIRPPRGHAPEIREQSDQERRWDVVAWRAVGSGRIDHHVLACGSAAMRDATESHWMFWKNASMYLAAAAP